MLCEVTDGRIPCSLPIARREIERGADDAEKDPHGRRGNVEKPKQRVEEQENINVYEYRGALV